MTLYDLGTRIQDIRDTIDSVEIKGARNANLILIAYDKCNKLIDDLNVIADNELNKDKMHPIEVGESSG